ncbi:MAG: tRNA pseudouridine(55) synthase TruB [Thermodesulfobacteriota bacterium]|nr:MAG: tRNA pseudouridine(55) synthase TruB [Thermodesulfobacteriota bacterium]
MNGLIIINKPQGITSYTVVKRVMKILKVRKAGHTGTLDPFAQGILVVCLNAGTKLVPFLVEEDKEYQAILHLGIETDTQDITGRIIKDNRPVRIANTQIGQAFERFQGKIMQVPPMYSALKYNGVPLYQLARKGKEIERAPREVEIKELSIVKIDSPRVFFRVVCSKGTYIRTLANDLGKYLGCGAFLEKLNRTRSGSFQLEDSVTLENLEKTSLNEVENKWIFSPSRALSSLQEITVDEEISRKLYQGKKISSSELKGKNQIFLNLNGKIKILNPQGDLIAIAEAKDHRILDLGQPVWKLLRVFNRERQEGPDGKTG